MSHSITLSPVHRLPLTEYEFDTPNGFKMPYRRLGRSGLKVSALSFGSWVTFGNQMAEELARECMTVAYDHGVNFFDNAEVYADGMSETIMGQVLKKSGWARDSYIVSSKVFWGGSRATQSGLSRKHITDACHAALKRLQVDYLDLYFCHRPDHTTPIEETVRAMDALVQQGKILYWGTSEWSAQQITEAFQVAKELGLSPPTMEQPQYNLLTRDRMEGEYWTLFRAYGLGTTIWSPLASGLLTGKYNDGIPKDSRLNLDGYEWLKSRHESTEGQEKLKRIRQFCEFAKSLSATPAALAIAWCLKNPTVSTVILGASKVHQVKDNLKALDVLPRVTDSVLLEIEGIFQNQPPSEKDWF
jgi:voltage-dependent potassium channel beta subunit